MGDPAVCPSSGYVLNPKSGTCYRLVSDLSTWNESKAYCEAAGEHLVTFRTYQAAEWFAQSKYRSANIFDFAVLTQICEVKKYSV